MNKIYCIPIIALLSYSCTMAMELTNREINQQDHFSRIPNSCRKNIIFPLINCCTSYRQAKDTLLSVGLVSKKSYAQMNCIFFTTDVIHLLANKWKDHTGKVAVKLATPGAFYYKSLGDELYILSIGNMDSKKLRRKLYALLDKGADVNFQNTSFQRSALMSAVHNSNRYLVFALVKNGAHTSIRRNDKYVREHSILYQSEKLRSTIKKLFRYQQTLIEKSYTTEQINKRIHNYHRSEQIRAAIEIDDWLEKHGAPIENSPGNTKSERIQKLYDIDYFAFSIFTIILKPIKSRPKNIVKKYGQ